MAYNFAKTTNRKLKQIRLKVATVLELDPIISREEALVKIEAAESHESLLSLAFILAQNSGEHEFFTDQLIHKLFPPTLAKSITEKRLRSYTSQVINEFTQYASQWSQVVEIVLNQVIIELMFQRAIAKKTITVDQQKAVNEAKQWATKKVSTVKWSPAQLQHEIDVFTTTVLEVVKPVIFSNFGRTQAWFLVMHQAAGIFQEAKKATKDKD